MAQTLATSNDIEDLPRWDMSPYFPGLESAEFDGAFKSVLERLSRLKDLADRYDVRGAAGVSVDEKTVSAFEDLVAAMDEFAEELQIVRAYIFSFVATDARNDLAQGRLSELEAGTVEARKLETRFRAWIASLGAEALIEQSPVAADHAYMLRRSEKAAKFQMSEAEESLYAGLSLSGSTAWSRMFGNVTSRLTVEVELPDGTKTLPISRVRALAQDPEGPVREAAYRAELKGFETVAVPVAAALNGIKGEMITVSAARGWSEPLEAALFNNNIDHRTLEAMQEAVTESFVDFRRYLKAKARALGKTALPWWDLFAPLAPTGSDQRVWDWESATGFIEEQFASYSPKMGELAQRAFRDRWVDAGPREGKRDGAFCMGVRGDESRVLMNFTGSFNSVQTLAHELGHAYHNVNLAPRDALQRETPMTLAETASIFCQNLVIRAALDEASDAERLSILDGDLQSVCQVVVDIHSRFLFERGVFDRRAKRDLSVEELRELMLESQRATYGDGLDADSLHPFMWAAKPHYYGPHFYNFPYTFGLLFGLGLFARFREEPSSFKEGYDDLLSSTGLDSAVDLPARFGIDVRSASFWRSSLDVIRERINEFESLSSRASG